MKKCLLNLHFVCLFLLGLIVSGAAQQKEASSGNADSKKKKDIDTIYIKPEEAKKDFIYTSLPVSLSVASTAAIGTNEILKSNATDIRNALIGKLSGISTSQSSGQPGNDAVSLKIRGQDPLIVIDGIPRAITVFDLDEIESVTVLKDAVGTAMFGVRGSNGVISIITRKGMPGKQNVSFTVQSGIQQPVTLLKPVNAYNYAMLYNEALANDGIAPAYTSTDLQAYKDHSDPYGHPDIAWRNVVLNNNSNFNKYTLNFDGGNKTARYFVGFEHLNQKGFFITSNENSYNTNNDFKSYVIRSNVEVNLNKKVSMGLYLLGRILNGYQPGSSAGTILTNIAATPANAYPVFNPNGSLGGNTLFQNNIYGQVIRSGYQLNFKRDVMADFYLKRTLDEITKGLWVKGIVSFTSGISQTHNRNKTFAVYQMNISANNDTSYLQYGTNGTQTKTDNAIDYQKRKGYYEISLGYNRNFSKHGIDAIVLANMDNMVSGSDLPLKYQGISGRINYNYNKKYVADFSFGYNGCNRYPEGTRFRFFPAVGLGWNINEEAFMKGSKINKLKLYGSYGKTGNDDAGYFVYKQYYSDGSGYYYGTTASSNTSMNEQVLANPDIDYEKANKLNIGVDAVLLNNKLNITAEWHTAKYYDLLMQRGRSITLIGNDYPDENIGINRYSGTELTVKWMDNIGALGYYVSLNASSLKSKVIYQDEVYRAYDWMKRTGQPVGQSFGYTALGLFQTQSEINQSAVIEGYIAQPGDIKYKDLNGDGIINQFDQSPIGNTKAPVYYGIEFGFTYKGFDFNALLQGVYNRTISLTGAREWEFQTTYGQAFEHHLGRWTPSTAASATYPRLTVGSNINNDIAASSYWFHNGNYARVKFVEMGYSFSLKLLKKAKLEKCRVFVNGTNLFTFFSYNRVDPEVYGVSYPLQRIVNCGINVKF